MASSTCGKRKQRMSKKNDKLQGKSGKNSSTFQMDNQQKPKLFEDDDEAEEITLKVNDGYAKKYEHWKRGEERQKLIDRYGKDGDELEESSTSEEEDEDGDRLPPDFDKKFIHALACLRKKDSSIYNKEHKFFSDEQISLQRKSDQKSSDKPMYLHDYEREVLLGLNGNPIPEEGSSTTKKRPMTYVEEQNELKNSFKAAVEDSDDDGALFTGFKKKSSDESPKKQEGLLTDKEAKKEIKKVWPDELDEGEAFLRDFILQHKYIDEDSKKRVPTYEEIIASSEDSEAESFIEQQENFEQKYDFRFEEPDQEFIKKYPRTMLQSYRVKDKKRSEKRSEIKERKEKEKQQKLNELKRLKALKRAEIAEKLDKIKKITGNTKVGFGDVDLNDDFDPEEHDKRMKQIFDDEYYDEEEVEEPELPFEEEDLQVDNWDEWEGNNGKASGLHCEDPDFVMDCDYDPSSKEHVEKDKIGKKDKTGKKKKRGDFRSALRKKKPIFDPENKKFEDYFDEYYKLDYEDIIGDLPCRFKYRDVAANDFGLSVDEVLTADDKELNQWSSLKKACQYRNEEEELYDITTYKRHSKNIKRKMKILKSVYQTEEGDESEERNTFQFTETADARTVNSKNSDGLNSNKKSAEKLPDNKKSAKQTPDNKKSVKQSPDNKKSAEKLPNNKKSEKQTPDNKKSAKQIPENKNSAEQTPDNKKSAGQTPNNKKSVGPDTTNNKKRKRSRRDRDHGHSPKKAKNGTQTEIPDERLKAYGLNPKKFKNKLKYGKSKQAAE